VLEDIRDISNAIKRVAEEEAIDLYFLLGNETPYFVIKIIEGFILRINEKIAQDDIMVDRKNNCFTVRGKKINTKNYYSFFEQIQSFI
jgi:hypothetical protein